MMPFAPPIFAAARPVVNLDGHIVIDIVSGPGLKVAGVIFKSNGTVQSVIGTTLSQIDSLADWIRPANFADGTYEVRFISPTGTYATQAAAENIWISLGSDRRWDVSESGGGISATTATFQIRQSGGSVLDSAIYELIADDT